MVERSSEVKPRVLGVTGASPEGATGTVSGCTPSLENEASPGSVPVAVRPKQRSTSLWSVRRQCKQQQAIGSQQLIDTLQSGAKSIDERALVAPDAVYVDVVHLERDQLLQPRHMSPDIA
jgi:hypothetical protein